MLLSVEEKAALLYKGEGLAPMVRASTTPLRTLALSYGADFCYTEELMDRSLIGTIRIVNDQLNTIDYVKDVSKMAPKQQRKLQIDGGPALYVRIDPQREANKLICQIGSGEPELALDAARHIYQDVNAIDINMGCPKKFSVSGGMGSALLSDIDRACRITRTLVNEISSTNSANPIPISAKIRLLKDTQSTLDFITGLISRGGIHAIAIHGRQVNTPEVEPANWDELETVITMTKSKFPTLPILFNGDFYTRDEFTTFQQTTNASGVLLARPALYNTSIFRKPPPSTQVDTSDENNISSDCNGHPPRTTTGIYGYKSSLLLDKKLVIQDYLREAVRYDGHYKNIKYVVCEMMNSRRAPHARTPYLPQWYGGMDAPTIGTTCACNSLSEICQLWNVNYHHEQQTRLPNVANVVDTVATPTTTATERLAPGEHQYTDSYLLKMESSASDSALTAPSSLPSKRPRID